MRRSVSDNVSILVRIPDDIARALKEHASFREVSTNALLVEIISGFTDEVACTGQLLAEDVPGPGRKRKEHAAD